MRLPCSFHLRSVINQIVFTSPEATIIKLVSEVFGEKIEPQRSSKARFPIGQTLNHAMVMFIIHAIQRM